MGTFIRYNLVDPKIRWDRVLTAGGLGTMIIATLVGGCSSCNNYEYSYGTRAGVINTFSEKGYLWKTYEGQMALEGMVVSTGKTVGARAWSFSIDKRATHGENVKELQEKLNEALETGTKVKIKYIEAGMPWPSRGSTSYYIQSVEPITQKE